MVSRGDFKQMVRAVRAGSSWEQVRAALLGDQEDEHLRASVLMAAGVSPSPAVVVSEEEPAVEPRAKRKKG